MPQRITIIGGMPDDVDRGNLLDELRVRSGDDVEWDWIKASPPHYDVPKKLLRRLVGQLQHIRQGIERPTVVKLGLLHGRVANTLFKSNSDPILAPKSLSGIDDLIEWLFSPSANLIPQIEWHGNVSEAAFAAVLSKLIKNKSWNNNSQGHAWTKESDLLGQSPVNRLNARPLRDEAETLLRIGTNKLFLTKGGTQGKTPKEWCINLRYAPMAKRMIISQNFSELESEPSMRALHRRISTERESDYRIDGEIVNERVRLICRE